MNKSYRRQKNLLSPYAFWKVNKSFTLQIAAKLQAQDVDIMQAVHYKKRKYVFKNPVTPVKPPEIHHDKTTVTRMPNYMQLARNTALFFSDLLSRQMWYGDHRKLMTLPQADGLEEDGYFYCTQESLEVETTLNAREQKICCEILEHLGLLKTIITGLPSYKFRRLKFYKINNLKFDDYLKHEIPLTPGWQQDEEVEENEISEYTSSKSLTRGIEQCLCKRIEKNPETADTVGASGTFSPPNKNNFLIISEEDQTEEDPKNFSHQNSLADIQKKYPYRVAAPELSSNKQPPAKPPRTSKRPHISWDTYHRILNTTPEHTLLTDILKEVTGIDDVRNLTQICENRQLAYEHPADAPGELFQAAYYNRHYWEDAEHPLQNMGALLNKKPTKRGRTVWNHAHRFFCPDDTKPQWQLMKRVPQFVTWFVGLDAKQQKRAQKRIGYYLSAPVDSDSLQAAWWWLDPVNMQAVDQVFVELGEK
jgi:hypothetical protein